MADSYLFKFYILFLLFFSIMIAGFNVESKNFDLNSYTIVFNTYNALHSAGGLYTIFSYVLLPFTILDILILLFGLIFFTFSSIPIYLSSIIIAPLGIFIVIDYIIPSIRGN